MSQSDLAAVRSGWMIGFGVIAVAHLILNAADLSPYDSISKAFLAPLLMAWVIQLKGPALLVAALAFCFLGDVLLEFEPLFAAGMAAFGAAQVCFIVFFVQRGALDALRARPWIAIGYAIVAVCMVVWLWPDLPSDIRPLVPIYAVLLATTAATALAVDVRAGIGAALFLISDGLIAANAAGRLAPDSVGSTVVIMTLYILAIFVLTTAIVGKERRSVAAAQDGFDPTKPTDCWPTMPNRAR